MKKLHLLKRTLLLFALIVGCVNYGWADTSTLTFTAACGGSGKADDGASWTVASDGTESSFDSTKGIHYGTNSAQVQYITLTTSSISGTITKVVVNASTASGVSATASVTVGGSAFGGDPKSLSSTATDYTFNGSASGEIVVTVTKPSKAAKAIYVKSVTVTYSAGPSYIITAQSNNNTYGTVSLLGSVITGSPNSGYRYATPAYTVSPAESATVSQEGNEFTVTPSANTTVTINFEAIPSHNAIFSVNGNTTPVSYIEGASIAFPDDPADIDGKKFVGWYTSEYSNPSEAPAFVNTAAQTMGMMDIIYYAVFATAAGSEEKVTDNLTRATTGVTSGSSSYSNWSGKTATSSAVYAGNSAGGNDAIQLRTTNSNSGVITTASGGKAKKVTVVWDSNTADGRTLNVYGKNSAYSAASDLYGANSGTLLGTIVMGTSTELTITGDYTYIGVRSSSNAMYLSSVSIDWTVGSITYSDYTTSVDTRSEAGISFSKAEVNALLSDETYSQALNNPNSITVTYSSSNEDIATVAVDGTVTLKTAGTVTITASFAGNEDYKPAEVSYTLTITAKKVADLVFDSEEVEKLTTDAAFTNGVVTDPVDITLAYSSSNTEVATVNASTGEVTIVGAGETTITATINDVDYEATEYTYTLTVSKADAPISFSSASAEIAIDETESFVAPTLSNLQSLTIVYSSSNTSVATVDENTGAITFVAVGETTITATSTETAIYKAGSVSYTLTVDKAAKTLPFAHSFISGSGFGDFTPSASGIWTAHNTYGAVAQGITDGNWLYSPIINLVDETAATLTFSQATNGVTTPLAEKATLWVREVGGDWAKLTTTYSDNASWTYVDQTVSLNSYCGKKIQLAFKYISDNSTGKWEIKNFRVADDREEAPISFAEATVYELLKNKDTYTGQVLTNDESLTVSYTSSNTDVATVNSSTGVVTIKAVGETNITATYAETAEYKANTATYKLVVTSKTAAAIEYAETEVEEVITSGTFTNPLTNPNDLTIAYSSSDETVATINASTGEVTMLKVGETTITATFTEDEDYEGAVVTYTLTVIKDNPTLTFAKSSVNAGLADGTYRQVVTTVPADLPVTYSSSDETVATIASDGTATLLKQGTTTITANFAGNDLYNSASVTYTLTVVVDYATLPFEYNDGKSGIGESLTSGTKGFMQSGLGSDYASAPYLKFDTTGDYMILKVGETPGTLSFDIKGNGYSSSSTSTFKVQTSANGEGYSDLVSFTELDGTATTMSYILSPDIRYIKWIYTEKGASSGGNVALGNIKLSNTVDVTVGDSKFLSFCYGGTIDFSESGLKVYKAKVVEGQAMLTEITDGIVPANTGVILNGEADKYVIPFTDASATADFSDNELVGVTQRTQVQWNPETDVYNYILQQGKFLKATDGYLKPNRAYLSTSYDVTSVGARALEIVFDEGETTGIANANVNLNANDNYYNLNGQRVATPVKGNIYIVNGKKVMFK